MASKQTILTRLHSLFPDRLTLSPEEVAGVLYGKPTEAVVESVRSKCRSGQIKGRKLGRAKQDPWLIAMDDLADVLAEVEEHSQANNTPKHKPPISHRKGKRSHPLVNPHIRAWIGFWIDTARIAGLVEAQKALSQDLAEIEAIRKRQRAYRTRRKIKGGLVSIQGVERSTRKEF